jgi:hypothetical protein
MLDGRPVGTAGLSHIDPANRRAELGILLGDLAARGTGTTCNLPRRIFTAEVSMMAFSTNALPVCLWQSVQ